MVFEEPLRNLDGRILYGDNQAFIPGVTSYTDDQLVVWVFDSWYDNEAFIGEPYDFTTTDEIVPSHNLQFYAKWVKKPIHVTYDADIGTLNEEGDKTETITQPNGDIAKRHSDANAPAGMRFYGWSLNGMIFDFNEPFFEDVELVAIYYPDVTPYRRSKKWIARINFKKKTYWLGSYDDITEAIKARQRGEEMRDNFLEWYYAEFRIGTGNSENAEVVLEDKKPVDVLV